MLLSYEYNEECTAQAKGKNHNVKQIINYTYNIFMLFQELPYRIGLSRTGETTLLNVVVSD